MMLKNKIKKIYKSDNFPLLIYMILVTISTLLMQKTGADDIFFSNVCNDKSFLTYLIEEYQGWSSRIFIIGIIVVFCQYLPMVVWKIANIGMYYLLIYSLSKLITVKNQRKMNYILAGSLICIPIAILAEAGWISTSNNYLWVAAMGLYAIIPLKKLINNEKMSSIQIISYIIAIIYATNQEQMAGILFLVYTCFTFWIIKKDKKIKPLIIIIDILIILSLINILICPGNQVRKIQEEINSFPGYSELSLLEKIEIGLTSMMDYAILDERLIVYILLILISVILWKKSHNNIVKLLGISPLGIEVAFKYSNKLFAEVDSINIMQTKLYMIFKDLTYIAILLLAGICIYLIFKEHKNIKKSLLMILIYLSGIFSRLVMAFSPTVYASQERTSYYWYISICILIVFIANEIDMQIHNDT